MKHNKENKHSCVCPELSLASLDQTDLSQKMGNYPIITSKDAKNLLLNGNYITSVPYQLPGEKFVAKTELIYRTGTNEKYFMPYYRFYVELPEEERDGLKTYGAYYVPAVEKNTSPICRSGMEVLINHLEETKI